MSNHTETAARYDRFAWLDWEPRPRHRGRNLLLALAAVLVLVALTAGYTPLFYTRVHTGQSGGLAASIWFGLVLAFVTEIVLVFITAFVWASSGGRR